MRSISETMARKKMQPHAKAAGLHLMPWHRGCPRFGTGGPGEWGAHSHVHYCMGCGAHQTQPNHLCDGMLSRIWVCSGGENGKEQKSIRDQISMVHCRSSGSTSGISVVLLSWGIEEGTLCWGCPVAVMQKGLAWRNWSGVVSFVICFQITELCLARGNWSTGVL